MTRLIESTIQRLLGYFGYELRPLDPARGLSWYISTAQIRSVVDAGAPWWKWPIGRFRLGCAYLPIGERRIDDAIIRARRFCRPPYLLQVPAGARVLETLEGATAALRNTPVAVIRGMNFERDQRCPLFLAVRQHMEKAGFVLQGISRMNPSPDAATYWRCDLLFERRSHESMN